MLTNTRQPNAHGLHRPRLRYYLLPPQVAVTFSALRAGKFPVSFAGVHLGRHVANPFMNADQKERKDGQGPPCFFRFANGPGRCRQTGDVLGVVSQLAYPDWSGARDLMSRWALKLGSRFPTRLASKKQRFCLSCLHQTPGDRRDPGRDAGRTIGAIRPLSKKKVNSVFVKIFV